MKWRPTFLAAVALTHSTMIGCKAASVSPSTVTTHRQSDPDFEAQVVAAQAHCIELLHSVTMRRALEGDLEPVYWQGIRVGSIKKFDGRLQIELLRAHMPTTFKTPGAKVNINTGPNVFGGNNVIFDSPVMSKLVEMRQRSLEKIRIKMANAVEVGTDQPKLMPPST